MMQRKYWLVGCVVLTVALAGCADSDTEPMMDESAEMHESEAMEAHTSDADLPESVQHAVAIAREIEATPDDTDAILERHGLTVETFEDMMYEISADPALSKAYNDAVSTMN